MGRNCRSKRPTAVRQKHLLTQGTVLESRKGSPFLGMTLGRRLWAFWPCCGPRQRNQFWDCLAEYRSASTSTSRCAATGAGCNRTLARSGHALLCGGPKLPPRDQKHYGHRWTIERTFGWLKHLRRLNTRWEYHATSTLASGNSAVYSLSSKRFRTGSSLILCVALGTEGTKRWTLNCENSLGEC
jgi:transposase